VTYMPRGTGVRNADTIEQRGRFFGYKRSYAGLCRAWLTPDAVSAFTDYVDHETAMRAELTRHALLGESLKDWRRAFILSPDLKPTRSAVVRLSTTRVKLADSWFQQWQVPIPIAAGDVGETNQALTDSFCSGLAFTRDSENPGWTDMQRHSRATVPLAQGLERFLAQYEMVEGDSSLYTVLLLGLVQRVEKDPDASMTVFKMSAGASRRRTVEGDTTKLKALFQGAAPQRHYPGDRDIHDASNLSLQIHLVNVYADGGDAADDEVPPRGSLIRERVPVIALRVPKGLEISGVAQK